MSLYRVEQELTDYSTLLNRNWPSPSKSARTSGGLLRSASPA
ncbi:MAG: hypothetical protein ACUVQQ_11530 [Thermogutta sp.]